MVFGKLLHLNKLLLILIPAFALLAYLPTKDTANKPPSPIRKVDLKQLADGDLIFRKGRDLVSSLVLSQGNSAQFSHVGIIIKKADTVSVVHALPEDVGTVSGVQIESFSSFSSFDNATDIAVYRLKGIDKLLRKKVIAYSLLQVGKVFDNDFLLSTDDQIYCTELAIKAYQFAGIKFTDLAPIKIILLAEQVVPPDHLRQSTLFEQIRLTIE